MCDRDKATQASGRIINGSHSAALVGVTTQCQLIAPEANSSSVTSLILHVISLTPLRPPIRLLSDPTPTLPSLWEKKKKQPKYDSLLW